MVREQDRMQIRNSAICYGTDTKALHWMILVLVAYQFATGSRAAWTTTRTARSGS
jgi:cytochrome b561